MKIRSRFKDYYDHIGHRYGEDPDVTYIRAPLKITEVRWNCRDYFQDTIARSVYVGNKSHKINEWLDFEFVVAGSHVVTYITTTTSTSTTYERLTEQHEHLLEKDWRNNKKKYPEVPSDKHLEDLVRIVGHPVFLIRRIDRCVGRNGRREDTICLAERIPILADMGFSSFISPEALWQDIYATLTNVLRKNPDKEPPVTVANEYKIHAAGFDLKTSFRHPVNQKRPKK
jgi:hypothetical protein